MHSVSIRPEIVDRVRARRGRTYWFDHFDPTRTALIVVDMQSTFCAPGSPAEVPESRDIVGPINRLAPKLRLLGATVIWIVQANTFKNGRSDWEIFFQNVVGGEVRERSIASVGDGVPDVWKELQVEDSDHVVPKNRYSALSPGASRLEQLLRRQNIDTILVAGTKTNVCCESLARDAMMLDYKVVMLSDCCAALSDDEHRFALENCFQQFGDVLTSSEVLEKMKVSSSA